MSTPELLALFEKSQKDYFIAQSLMYSAIKEIKSNARDIIVEKYENEIIKIGNNVLDFQKCKVDTLLWSDRDYRKEKIIVDILFVTKNRSKENKKNIDKVFNDFDAGNDIKAEKIIAQEFRFKLLLINVLEGNFSFKF